MPSYRSPSTMQVRDLRREAPRRWNEELDGIIWLPRLIDKTRAAIAGTLGPYLFGQSPIDREFLRELRMGHRAFAQIVADAPDDSAVLAAIAQRDPQALESARAWSTRAAQKHATFFRVLDIDDGYAPGLGSLKGVANALSFALTWVVKRLSPSRALEGVKRS